MVTIIDQYVLEASRASGIDSAIRSLIQNRPKPVTLLVGMGQDKAALGRPRSSTVAGQRIVFLPVALAAPRGLAARLPDSLRLIAGLIRWRRQVVRNATGREIHVHRLETGGAVRLLFWRARIIQFIHNDTPQLTGINSDSFWRHLPPVYRLLERFALRSAHRIVIFSRPGWERLRRRRSDIILGTTGFDPNVFFPRTSLRSDGPLRILWVGRFEAQKDPVLAVKVLDEVRIKSKGAVLTMVGSGELYPQVMAAGASACNDGALRLPGALSSLEVADLMRESDVLLVTSHYEGSPTVLAEAGGAGLPVATTVAADPDEFVANGRNGFRTGGRSPADLGAILVEAARLERAHCSERAAWRTSKRLAVSMWEKLGE